MPRIIRTPSIAAGGVTPHELDRMREISELWIRRAFRTDPIEPAKIVPAIHGLYRAAGLKLPRVVIVPSPLVMAFAYGAAAAIWHVRKTGDATFTATVATDHATRAAINRATDRATRDAIYRATSDATDRATRATRAAINRATDPVTLAATYRATADATARATADATYRATSAAVDRATRATRAAINRATYTATYRATYTATARATADATYLATSAAVDRATGVAAHDAVGGAAEACHAMAGDFGLDCAAFWYRAYQGGNGWADFPAYVAACRDVLGLRLPAFAAYQAWEDAAIAGGFRVMHDEFCMVSDFPEILRTDDAGRPHAEDGPSHRWRDGWSLWHWHGTVVPQEWVENRRTLDPAVVLRASNVEQRAAGAAMIGWPRMMAQLDCRVIDHDPDPSHGDLIELTLPGLPEAGRFLRAECPRNGLIVEGVPRSDDKGRPIETTRAAQAWRVGLDEHEFRYPERRT